MLISERFLFHIQQTGQGFRVISEIDLLVLKSVNFLLEQADPLGTVVVLYYLSLHGLLCCHQTQTFNGQVRGDAAWKTQLSHGPIEQGLANISLLLCFHLWGDPFRF